MCLQEIELQRTNTVLSELQDKYSELEARYLATNEYKDLILQHTAKTQEELSATKEKAARVEELREENFKISEEKKNLLHKLEEEKEKTKAVEYSSQAAQEAFLEQHSA